MTFQLVEGQRAELSRPLVGHKMVAERKACMLALGSRSEIARVVVHIKRPRYYLVIMSITISSHAHRNRSLKGTFAKGY